MAENNARWLKIRNLERKVLQNQLEMKKLDEKLYSTELLKNEAEVALMANTLHNKRMCKIQTEVHENFENINREIFEPLKFAEKRASEIELLKAKLENVLGLLTAEKAKRDGSIEELRRLQQAVFLKKKEIEKAGNLQAQQKEMEDLMASKMAAEKELLELQL